jgi:hypothetical protein
VNFWKKKRTKEILRDLLPLSKGETIESVIRKLADEVCQLRNSNINLLHQRDTAVQDISCLLDTLMELIPEENRNTCSHKFCSDFSVGAKSSLVNERQNHADEPIEQENQFKAE